MLTINLNTGINSIGIPRDTTVNLDSNIHTKYSSVKTLIDGEWMSWTNGAPIEFQGLTTLDKGRGYIIKATEPDVLEIEDNVLDVNTVSYNPGMNLLAIPNKGIIIPSIGIIPKFEVTVLKAFFTTWESWTKNTPTEFQGFNSLDEKVGYISEITKVYDEYLSKEVGKSSGDVQLGLFDVKEKKALQSKKVAVLDNNYNILVKDTEPAVSPTSNSRTTYVEIDGEIKAVTYPEEFEGLTFSLNKIKLDVIDLGPIVGSTATLNVRAAITEALDYNLVSKNITDITLLIDKEVLFTFDSSTTDTTPSTPVSSFNDSILEIVYDKKTITDAEDMKIMAVGLNSEIARLSFNSVYTGEPFRLINDGTVLEGTFTESSTPITLTVLN